MNSEKIAYIALLRGINVGGHVVKMEQLRNLFVELGLENVRSYIQTGNVFFETEETDVHMLRNKIESHLESALGFTVPTSLRTIQELEQIVALDPFKEINVKPDIRLAIMFLAEPSKETLQVPYITPDGGYEVVGRTEQEFFVVWHLKNGRPGNSYGLLEKLLKVPTTTRFWHTTLKILESAKNKNI